MPVHTTLNQVICVPDVVLSRDIVLTTLISPLPVLEALMCRVRVQL